MKKTGLIVTLALIVAGIHAQQQPFEKYGYKVKIATLSKGKFVESFDQDSLIQIGSVVLNRRTGKITSFVTYDTTYSEATLQPELISRWMSPDPLADSYFDYSPYHFSGNNPIRFVDPTGMFFIDYYNENGNRIGTDGNNDSRVVVVTDKDEAKAIKATDKAGGKTDYKNVSSGVELPSAFVRGEMGAAVDRSNRRNDNRTDDFRGDDNEGRFHEEGGVYGTMDNGSEKVVHAAPGGKTEPDEGNRASVTPGIPANSNESNMLAEERGSFHVHPSGSRSPGPNTIGGVTRYFTQSPTSPDDYNEAKNYSGNSYVLGAGNGTVYVINGSSNAPVATFPLKAFRSIGIR